MAILGIHHVAVIVPSLKQGLDFYSGLLGFKVIEEASIEPGPEVEAITNLKSPRATSIMLRSGWGYLELFEYQSPRHDGITPDEIPVNGLGIRHFCLAVDNCQAEYDRLKSAMHFNCPPINLGWSADGHGPWVTYGRDPFGNLIELWQLTAEDPPLFPPLEAQH